MFDWKMDCEAGAGRTVHRGRNGNVCNGALSATVRAAPGGRGFVWVVTRHADILTGGEDSATGEARTVRECKAAADATGRNMVADIRAMQTADDFAKVRAVAADRADTARRADSVLPYPQRAADIANHAFRAAVAALGAYAPRDIVTAYAESYAAEYRFPGTEADRARKPGRTVAQAEGRVRSGQAAAEAEADAASAADVVDAARADHPCGETRFYVVAASHMTPRYALAWVPVRVTREHEAGGGGFYADHHPHGCGKTRATAADAIRELLASNGCQDIRIARVNFADRWAALAYPRLSGSDMARAEIAAEAAAVRAAEREMSERVAREIAAEAWADDGTLAEAGAEPADPEAEARAAEMLAATGEADPYAAREAAAEREADATERAEAEAEESAFHRARGNVRQAADSDARARSARAEAEGWRIAREAAESDILAAELGADAEARAEAREDARRAGEAVDSLLRAARAEDIDSPRRVALLDAAEAERAEARLVAWQAKTAEAERAAGEAERVAALAPRIVRRGPAWAIKGDPLRVRYATREAAERSAASRASLRHGLETAFPEDGE
jgi:hypothetical protein